jgi:phosphate transporter family protein
VDTKALTLTLVFAALIGAIAWSLITWALSLPSSSSHALIGGVVGATIAAIGSDAVKGDALVSKVPRSRRPLAGRHWARRRGGHLHGLQARGPDPRGRGAARVAHRPARLGLTRLPGRSRLAEARAGDGVARGGYALMAALGAAFCAAALIPGFIAMTPR